MRNDRQALALAQLLQLRRQQALAERRQALAASARVQAVDRQIRTIDAQVATEVGSLAQPADLPAMGRWADLMDGKRAVLGERRAAEQRQAEALALRAAKADTVAEQYRELLKDRRLKLAEDRRRARDRATWEALALLLTTPSRR